MEKSSICIRIANSSDYEYFDTVLYNLVYILIGGIILYFIRQLIKNPNLSQNQEHELKRKKSNTEDIDLYSNVYN